MADDKDAPKKRAWKKGAKSPMTLMGLRDPETGEFTFPEKAPQITPLPRIEPHVTGRDAVTRGVTREGEND